MDLNLESNIITIVVGNHCSVGFVVRIIVRRIFHCTRVEDLRSIVLKRHKYLGMLVKSFLEFM